MFTCWASAQVELGSTMDKISFDLESEFESTTLSSIESPFMIGVLVALCVLR